MFRLKFLKCSFFYVGLYILYIDFSATKWLFITIHMYISMQVMRVLIHAGDSQHNMLKTLTNSYEQIRSIANKNEVRVNELIKIRKNEVTTSFLIHENEFVILN